MAVACALVAAGAFAQSVPVPAPSQTAAAETVTASTATDNAAARRRAVEEMLAASGRIQLVDAGRAQFEAKVAQYLSAMSLADDEQPLATRYSLRVATLLKKELSWEALKDPLVDVYLKTYSDDEIAQMMAFYQSPVGRKMVAKTPEVMRDSASIIQSIEQRLAPKIRQLNLQFAAELASHRQGR